MFKQRDKLPHTSEQKCSNQPSISKYFSSSTEKTNRRKRNSADSVKIVTSPPKISKLSLNEKTHKNIQGNVSNSNSSSNNLFPELLKPSTAKLKHFSFNKVVLKDRTSENWPLDESNCSTSNSILFTESGSKTKNFNLENDKADVQNNISLEADIKYTPLEKQYLEFQAKYPDAVLFIECGYKYRFFGKDAEIAAKELNIGCYQTHNFLSAIIPVHRLHHYVRQLIIKGYKVGIIKQTESAALKAAGETRNDLFSRELYAMYTKSTFIDGDIDAKDDEKSIEINDFDEDDLGSGYLMCIYEGKSLKNHSKSISITAVAVQVKSGTIIYTSFEDNLIQSKLESCLLCLNPSEVIVPSLPLSKMTENLLKMCKEERSARIEKLDHKIFEHSYALSNISSLISSERNSNSCTEENLQVLLSLPPKVISCLSALKVYLSEFKVEGVLKNIKNIQPFATTDCMVLNPATIKGLELLKSNSNSNYGSFFWCLNQTLTKFGERLLKSWIVRPLKNVQKIEERLNIVTEIMHSESVIFKRISKLLHKLPDLEKILCSVFYHKCSCHEFLKLVQALTSIHSELLGLKDKILTEIKVLKLKDILLNIMINLEDIGKYSSNIDPIAAKEGNKVNFFRDTTMYPSIGTCKANIADIEKKLNDLKPMICKILKLPGFKYTTVAGQKFLIEVPNSHLSLVPDEWIKISLTKQMSRFQSPEIISLCKEWNKEQERLTEAANVVWDEFLREFEGEFYKYKQAISYLAELDCFLSFAKLSKDGSYCRPIFVDSNVRTFDLQQSWHPVVVKFMGEENQFVANDIKLNATERCIIITGPNMGGKSTFIRQIAIIAIMAHIGCYVPAASATMPLFDGIYVRMGADDDLVHKKSTFMSEMLEASSILKASTSNSLVILDELGRGTSTNDGAAIAYATLEYLIKNVQCFTLFVTHYPAVIDLKKYYPSNILTAHMSYILKDIDDNDDTIEAVTFLYNVVPGISEKSYGINVAALAGISKSLLVEAQKKSKEMELKITIQRKLGSLLLKLQGRHDF